MKHHRPPFQWCMASAQCCKTSKKKSHFFIKLKSQMFLRQKWPKMATDNIIMSFFVSKPQCSSSFIVYGIQINVLTAWLSKEYFSVLYKWISHTVSNDAFFQKYLNVKNYFQILQCNFFAQVKMQRFLQLLMIILFFTTFEKLRSIFTRSVLSIN